MKYPEFKQVSYSEIAKDILKFWEEEKIFERSITSREGNETFTFYEGPPSAFSLNLVLRKMILVKKYP